MSGAATDAQYRVRVSMLECVPIWIYAEIKQISCRPIENSLKFLLFTFTDIFKRTQYVFGMYNFNV